MRKAFAICAFIVLLSVASFAKVNRAENTHHTIKATARPFKAIGRVTAKVATAVGIGSFEVFDATVIDPFGIALQALADGLDMFVGAPLEALPEPFEAIGDGVHFIYVGIDAAGQQLAK